MCYVTIFDGSGKPITVEVSREIYQVFADYEREMERQRKEEYRHRDARSWDTCLIFELPTEPLEQTYERMRTLREIQEALLSFTPKQRRRFLLHFAYGYTYLEIARMEGSNKSTVMRSAKTALKKNSGKAGGIITTFARFLSYKVKGKRFPLAYSTLTKNGRSVHISIQAFICCGERHIAQTPRPPADGQSVRQQDNIKGAERYLVADSQPVVGCKAP